MSGKRTSAGPRRRAWGLITAIGLGVGFAGCLLVSANAQPPMQPKDQPKDQPKEPPKDEKKDPVLVEFSMDGEPWSKVMEWLVEKTGKNFIGTHKPTGTLTFKAPKGKKYTLPQIIDILNEALITQKYLLIQKEHTFQLVPADEKIEAWHVPRIKLEELDSRGNTEIVSVIIKLNSVLAEDIKGEFKTFLGPFGEMTAIVRTNQLVIQDTAGNVKRIRDELVKIDIADASSDTFSHVCKFIKARDAERIVKELLGDKNKQAVDTTPQYDRYGRLIPPPPPPPTSKRAITVTSDEIKNMVLVNGPADLVSRAKKIITDLDQGKTELEIGTIKTKMYPIGSSNSDATVKTLQEAFKNSTTVRIFISGSSIVAIASPEDQKEIENLIKSTQVPTKTQLVSVGALDATKVADTLKAMFGDFKTGGPYIEAQPNSNAVAIRGSDDQVKQVVDTIKILGGDVTGGGNIRVFTLEKGSAVTLAEALQKVLPEMRKNPIKVISPGGSSTTPGSGGETSPRPMEKVPDKVPDKKPEEKRTSLDDKTLGQVIVKADTNRKQKKVEQVGTMLVTQSGGVLSDPQNDKRTGSDKPILITAFGNRLVVTTEDADALTLIAELVRLITTTPGGEGDFEVIRLRVATASECARVLDEAFNGPRQPQQQQRGGGGGGGGGLLGLIGQFGGSGAQAPTNPTTDRVRIVADPSTNSLLVRASPLDMLTIRRILEKALDVQETDSEAIVKSWMLPVKHATASEVATLLKDVYKDATSGSSQQNMTGVPSFALAFGGGGQQQQQRSTGAPKQTLSVGVDERSNTLVLACTELMYKDIKKLVEELDDAAKDNNKTVHVLPIKGVDPFLLQQAVEAVQGKKPTTTRPGTTNQGGFQQGGGGFQGFQPGGGGFTRPGGTQGGGGGGAFPGGGRQGGGGGGGGGRGGRTGSLPPQERGPDFFEHRVMDDPQSTLLYDPHQDSTSVETSVSEPLAVPPGTLLPGGTAPLNETSDLNLIHHTEQQPPPMPQPMQPMQPPGQSLVAPRGPVSVEALEQLGIIVISGNNPADVAAILKVIEYLQENITPTSEIQIELFLLKEGDATSIVTTLNQLFSRVNFGVSGNSTIIGGGQRGGGFQQGGGGQGFQQGQQGQQGFQQGQQGQQQQGQQPQGGAPTATPQNVVLIPLPRFNGILVAVAKARMADIKKEIDRLDQKTRPDGQVTAFPLKYASASRIATLLTNFYNTRYPNESATQHQTRFTSDDRINTLFVQAGPADLAEIQQLIFRLDNSVSSKVNELRIVPLKYAQADELAAVLLDAITDNIVSGGTGATGLGQGQQQQGPQQGLTPTGPLTQNQQGRTGSTGLNGVKTTTTAISFRSLRRPDDPAVETALFEDVQISSDLRTNSLIISAQEKTMALIFNLVDELDVLPNSRARINVFSLTKGDATAVGTLLLQLFGGATGGGAQQGQVATGAGSTTTTGLVPRITVDQRTNSIIVAAGLSDLDVIEAIVTKLEDSPVEQRQTQVVLLRNATAFDVANTLTTFIQTGQTLTGISFAPQVAGLTELERQAVIIPEPITNKLLISASPRFFPEIMRLIGELDSETPMVVIQVLIAEIDLTGVEDFGVEIGLQSPVLFQRGGGQSTDTTTNQTVAGVPGFDFVTGGGVLPNAAAIGQGIVGFQGLSSLGTGRVGSNGQSGFVFQASSDTFNLLVRALKSQGRADILSRPQVTTLDNQFASVFVGQYVPIVTGTVITVGVAQPVVEYTNVGIELNVTPKIHPDGRVVMRVTPSISSLSNTTVNLGNGFLAPQINQQYVDTTVAAYDGETVAVGGLISKRDLKNETKIPYLGDLPGVGALFRFRTQVKTKQELFIILTPHIVRNRAEADAILAYESRRMDWLIGDVMKTQGPTGLDPILPPPSSNPSQQGDCNPGFSAPTGTSLPMGTPTQPLPLPTPTPTQPEKPASRSNTPQPMPTGPGEASITRPATRTEVVAPIIQTGAPPLLRPVPTSSPQR